MNNKLVLGLSLAVAFLLGCVVSQAVAPTPPPAWAGAPGTVQKWDYYCFDQTGAETVMPIAKQAGSNGWELVGGSNRGEYWSTWCFKRPL